MRIVTGFPGSGKENVTGSLVFFLGARVALRGVGVTGEKMSLYFYSLKTRKAGRFAEVFSRVPGAGRWPSGSSDRLQSS